MFKKQIIDEINELHIEGMPKLDKLNALVEGYVNLACPLPNGASVKFLNDQTTYLGNQLESEFGGDRCFGVLANMDFIINSNAFYVIMNLIFRGRVEKSWELITKIQL